MLSVLTLVIFSAAARAQDDSWDVEADHGPGSTVKFEVTEGTWINLDVSPDGREIVFDLLGDLYVLPIEGGDARVLTHGSAFDVQPRFSPDGSRIAFTSDRGGGDNIWIVKRDGTDLRQVSNESFRLLNGPAWTPDGQYILARKHFTSTRSLGAGEVWMFHVSGGSGLQLTKRKNDQQDQGNDIAVSPDGRYVYFSEDVSGGSTFQYNKDPHGQIYAIRRLDRQTGDLTDLITGSGGAARAQPSPDGRWIAFVRRVRSKSVLYLYDRRSGAQRPIFDGLSHDQQEAWAIFGVYPGFDWTPDSESIIIWAQGKLRRINVATGTAQVIPFAAKVSQRVAETVRFQQEVSADSFLVRMIRQAVTSPDGRTLVFNALGHLWQKRLPDGTPVRLTGDDHFEHDPAFSPDGSKIAYTTWSDADLGAVRIMDPSTGRSEKLTEQPGYYHTPSFSPDGTKIVYRRGRGNSLLGYVHGTEPGIYWISAHGGEAHLVREGGQFPRFTHSGDRIHVRTGGGLDKQFRSVDLNGSDEQTHFDLKYATDVVPSPDGKWVAFTELFNVYVAPFPQTGTSIALSKDTKAFPVTRVSRDAGTSLHWSADSRQLHWVLGPEYFSRNISGSFPFLDSASSELPPPDSTGVAISLHAQEDRPTGQVAFTGARIITMKGEEVITRGTVITDGHRISAVGPDETVPIPNGAHVVDASGKTIMPGIVDAHAHANHFTTGPMPEQNWGYFANLAFGVTTAHDPSANTQTVFALSEMVRAGRIAGPRIYSTGTILYGADGDFKAVINSLDPSLSLFPKVTPDSGILAA